MSIDSQKLKNIIEAALMAIAKPMSVDQLAKLFEDEARPSNTDIKDALAELQQDAIGRGIELKEVASGFRYQAREEYSEWLSRMWEEKPAKYSRAALETLALIAYRQPVTRAEIEDVRGVGVSSSIIKTMMEREWIRVVGHRDVPGRPALYATTKQFLDYFNMHSLEELPSLAEIKDLEELHPELDLPNPDDERLIPPPTRVEVPESESESETQENTESDSTTESDITTELADTDAPVIEAVETVDEYIEQLEETDELEDIHTGSSSESFYAEPQAQDPANDDADQNKNSESEQLTENNNQETHLSDDEQNSDDPLEVKD